MDQQRNSLDLRIEAYMKKLIEETGGDLTPDETYEEEMAHQASLENARRNTLRAIRNTIKSNQDDKVKEVGDVVRIWDSSRLTYADTNMDVEEITEDLKVSNYDSIVVEIDCDYVASVKILGKNFDKVLDLKVWNTSTKRVYRTSSDYVKLK